MRVLLLGGVAVVDRERTHAITSHRQATILACLAGQAGSMVAVDHLIDDVWGAEAPATARNTLQVHVSGLRKLLGAACIESTRQGYRYAGERRDVDMLRFCELARRGISAAADAPAEASRLLRAALGLYRGDLLGVVPLSPGLDAERERLRQLWAQATLARFDVDLALGRHLLLVDELLSLARERPHDEEVATRLMVAFYRAGDTADALHVYGRIVHRLRADLGVDPGPRFRELHQRILRHDPDLAPTLGPSTDWRVPLDVPNDPLVGRDPMLVRLEAGLRTGRLHTLVGPSGIGKTRLATELASRAQGCYRDGAVLVDLAGATTADGVLNSLANALAGDLSAVPRDAGERRRVVAESRALVVLDDLAPERAIRAEIDELLASSGSVFVATSPRPTRLRGERIWSVPPLDDEDAADLLISRARQAGAVMDDDEETRAAAFRCVDLLDGLPAAVELAAPLAVNGLPELAATLSRAQALGQGSRWVSFTSSLDRLEPGEGDLLDLLAAAGAAVDAELLDDAGGGEHLAALVRDGLVVRSVGSHGRNLYALIGGLADHLADTAPASRREAAVRRLVPALARAVDAPDMYLMMMTADPARSRRLVALEPALVQGVSLARAYSLTGAAAEIALLLPELHFARYGVGPPPGRTDWLLTADGITCGRRIDLLLSGAAMSTAENRPARTIELIDEAERLARELRDPGRTGITLAHRSMFQLLLSSDLGDSDERRREAIQLAESTGRPDVAAATLGLLYPSANTPADLADGLTRAVAAARVADHHGLLSICLANLSMAELERGDVVAAAVHARESAALARDQHHRALATVSAEVAETAEVLAGSRAGLARVLASLELAMGHHELRRSTECLLRLAAGLVRLGRAADASACVGLFEALLTAESAEATAAERDFRDQWLGDIVPTPPAQRVADEIAHLVRRLVPEVSTVR